jgi:hypothetical protein
VPTVSQHFIMEKIMLDALIKKLEGEIAVARANVEVYLNHSVGIGEHPDVVEAIETQIEKMASAQEKIDTITKNFTKIGRI